MIGRFLNTHAQRFDNWVRNRFAAMNTELELLYSKQEDRANTQGIGEDIKHAIVTQGNEYIVKLLAEGNTDEGFEEGFDLLGNVGLFMASCRRHDITEPSRELTSPLVEASGLAMHLGATLGLTPRFATSHLATHNTAVDGSYKTFTSLKAESLFLEYNTRGIFAYKRAADALVRSLPLGISHPISYHLLVDAKNALDDVFNINALLYEELDTNEFFFSVRPYYKPYRVGPHVYRGANAGDFAGINEIDMLLGLCNANNISYSQLLVDKFLYMLPDDQTRLRDAMRRRTILDELLAAMPKSSIKPWFQKNAAMFLEVCKAHGASAAQHHDQLVAKFIEQPSSTMEQKHMENVTASGPPLSVLLKSLEKLKDLRMASPRNDIPSRYADIEKLRRSIKAN
jgi:hypothetical protein